MSIQRLSHSTILCVWNHLLKHLPGACGQLQRWEVILINKYGILFDRHSAPFLTQRINLLYSCRCFIVAALKVHVSLNCKEILDRLGGYQMEPRGMTSMKVLTFVYDTRCLDKVNVAVRWSSCWYCAAKDNLKTFVRLIIGTVRRELQSVE